MPYIAASGGRARQIGKTGFGCTEVVDACDTARRDISKRVDAPVASSLVSVIAANISTAGNRRRLVLQIQGTIRRPDVRQTAEAIANRGKPTSPLQSREAAAYLTLEAKCACIVVLNRLR